jgi:hypothetical protein
MKGKYMKKLLLTLLASFLLVHATQAAEAPRMEIEACKKWLRDKYENQDKIRNEVGGSFRLQYYNTKKLKSMVAVTAREPIDIIDDFIFTRATLSQEEGDRLIKEIAEEYCRKEGIKPEQWKQIQLRRQLQLQTPAPRK